jgi:hypothetical protein
MEQETHREVGIYGISHYDVADGRETEALHAISERRANPNHFIRNR